MPRTPDRTPGPSIEEETQFEEQTTDPTVLGAVRYVNGDFRMLDSVGVFNPRTAGAGDDADSLFNDLNESYDILVTETGCIPTAVLAHAPGAPSIKIREVDNFTFDAACQITGMRIRQFAANGTTVVETLTYNGTGWVKT